MPKIECFTSSRPLEQARDSAVSLFLSETLSMSALCCSSTSHTSTCPAALARINGVKPIHNIQYRGLAGQFFPTRLLQTSLSKLLEIAVAIRIAVIEKWPVCFDLPLEKKDLKKICAL